MCVCNMYNYIYTHMCLLQAGSPFWENCTHSFKPFPTN